MIREAFKQKKGLFIPFMMGGFPDFTISAEVLLALSAQGADIIEVGVPFSDPVADGAVNQYAAEVALSQGMTVQGVLDQVAHAKAQGCQTPIILFSYLNPILAFGLHEFAQQARQSGVDGILIVDLPPEEGVDLYPILQQAGLEIVLLASPTTDPARYPLYRHCNPAFIYYISRLAVTGVQEMLSSHLQQEVDQLRRDLPDLKIAVGFGISTPEQATAVAAIADGVIVGSRLVKTLGDEGIEAFKELSAEFATAVHQTDS